MAKRTFKIITGVVLSTVLVSNTFFVYANSAVMLSIENEKNKLQKISSIDKNVAKATNDAIKTLELEIEQSVVETVPQEQYVLSLLNMDKEQYREELRNGENLRTLLEKNGVTDEFDQSALSSYKNALNVAVTNNAITIDEMNQLLTTYVDNMKKVV